MRMKSIITLVVALVFAVGIVSFAFAADDTVVKGTVTKIEGTTITVKNSAGKETKVTVSDPKVVKVGDRVTVKDGVVKKKSVAGY